MVTMAEESGAAATKTELKLPGWNLPLNHHETAHFGFRNEPCATCGFQPPSVEIVDQARTYEMPAFSVLEHRMIEVMGKITDKPDWQKKIHDATIVDRWTEEARNMFEERDRAGHEAFRSLEIDPWVGTEGRDPSSEDQGASSSHGGSNAGPEDRNTLDARLRTDTQAALRRIDACRNSLSQPISRDSVKFCFDELKDKAKGFTEHKMVSTLGFGGPDIVKSDVVIPDAFRERFMAAAKKLESSIEVDWHPGQEGMVRDLVHPSLHALHYGRTLVLPNSIPLADASSYTGSGEILKCCPDVERGRVGAGWNPANPIASIPPDQALEPRQVDFALINYSREFQWLPAEVRVNAGGAKFTSYINNLDYPQHQTLYELLGQLVDYSIPLWDHSLAVFDSENYPRWRRHRVASEDECWEEIADDDIPRAPQRFWYEGITSSRPGEGQDAYYEAEWKGRWKHFMRQPRWPGISPYAEWAKKPKKEPPYDLRKHFDTLQIIVKLANIELTPENPQYLGGGWHVEGLANEHICATSIFYYDSENVSESRIEFRCGGTFEDDEPRYAQDRFAGLERVFGTPLRTREGICNLASVTTPQGRLLAFPNVFQHRVKPFKLVDATKPGHRKIALLWLVNPEKRIISTAQVPPQQRRPRETLIRDAALSKFPGEICNMITQQSVGRLDTEEQAKANRVRLMDERRVPATTYQKIEAEYSFCEH